MIYVTCVFVYCVIEDSAKPRYGKLIPIAGALYSIAVTAIYLVIHKPVFHEVAYALLVTIVILRSVRWLSGNSREENRLRQRIFSIGIVSYLGAFLLWNIDNHFCLHLHDLREQIGWAGFLLQLHGWWHVLTGLGTYLWIMLASYVRMNVLKKPAKIATVLGIIPVLQVQKAKQ